MWHSWPVLLSHNTKITKLRSLRSIRLFVDFVGKVTWFLFRCPDLCVYAAWLPSEFVVLQSSWWGKRESWLLYLNCLPGVLWLLVLCDPFSRRLGLVCSVWLWYILIILTCFLKTILVSILCWYVFHILVLQQYWVLAENRIPLKPVLGRVRIVALPLVLMNRLNKTEYAVFLYCRFSLFLKDPFFPDYWTHW